MDWETNWHKFWEVQYEYNALKRRGHKVKKGKPFNFKKYGPPIHIHDKTEKQIVHVYCGPYNDISLFELQRELANIRSGYINRSEVNSIRLVLIDGEENIPDWFIPSTLAMLPEKDNITMPSGTLNSFISVVETRDGSRIPVKPPRPRPTPPGPPNPPPGWNGIPGLPVGKCEENLMVDLTITMNFGSMMDELNRCQSQDAERNAKIELQHLYEDNENGFEPLSGRLLKEMYEEDWLNIPHELIVKHRAKILKKGYERCAEQLICPILMSAMNHHEECKHKTIVIKVPSQIIQEIEDYKCWKNFEDFLGRDDVDWMTLPV